MQIVAANSELTHVLSRSAIVAEIAERLNITEEVLEGLEGARVSAATSRSTLVNDESGLELGDTLSTGGARLRTHRAADRSRPRAGGTGRTRPAHSLPPLLWNRSQSEIAEDIGISQMHVSRLIAKALATLRKDLGGSTAPEKRVRRRS